MIVFTIFMLAAGYFILHVGYLIRKKGKVTFIAGYGEAYKPKDEKQLADRIGLNLMLLGAETLLFPLAYHLSDGFIRGPYYVIAVVVHVVIVFILIFIDQIQTHKR